MRVLVVEDDPRIATFIEKGLGAEGYSTVCAKGAREAMALAPDLGVNLDFVLLDLGLPDGDGLAVLRHMRRCSSTVPVVILTARGEVEEKVRGLDLGANDYITKPFSFDEFLARIRAAARSNGQSTATELEVEDLRLDLMSKVAWRSGRRIDLSPREWALLELFLRHPTRVLSRQVILSHVWDYDFDPGSNVADVYVGYLRRKLNRPGLSVMIHTVRGSGYRLLQP